MAEVSLKKVVKRYGDIEIVHGIDLEIENNEFIVLVGPSGCGKSTTLRMIAGLEEITDGTISINDKVVNDLSPKDRDLAMVFQNYALYPHMTVYENMAFSLKLKKMAKDEIKKLVHNAAEILGLEQLLNRKPADLSGGQRQRVAMGRAIVRNPKVFLFDEPLSNLDAKLRAQMRTEIKLLHQKVTSTIIYVTHDQIEAMTLADRIVVMKDGYIEQIGEPMELFQNPVNTFVAGFIGNPAMNQIPAKVVNINGFLKLDIGDDIQIPVPEKPGHKVKEGMNVILGLRNEDMLVDNGTTDIPEEWKLTAHVQVVEPLGAESIVHVEIAGHSFLAKNEGRNMVETGADTRLALNLNHLHIFDAETTRSIY